MTVVDIPSAPPQTPRPTPNPVADSSRPAAPITVTVPTPAAPALEPNPADPLATLSTPRTSVVREILQPGIEVLRRLWLPFVAVQLLGLLLVVAYFQSAVVAGWCNVAAGWKAALGLPFASISMAIASGIVPELFKSLTGVERGWDRNRLTSILHNVAVFAFLGCTVDLLYTGLGTWLGDSREVGIVLTKVFIDQAGYTPFFSVPVLAFSYTLRTQNYSVPRALRAVDRGWYGREVAPVLVVCWAYWIPMVTLAYVLPPKLTYLYGLVASAASSTLLVAIASRKRTLVAAASTP